MRNFEFKQFTRRHRPHVQPPGATFFVTYRLAGSIPKCVVNDYEERRKLLENELRLAERAANTSEQRTPRREQLERFQRQWFAKFEMILHQSAYGPTWMKDDRVAKIVADGVRELDGKDYRLDCYCIMSNHVHIVFKPFVTEANLLEVLNFGQRPSFFSPYPGLPAIMKTLKGRSARKANILLERTGRFWEHESFDHVVRAGRLQRTVNYVLNNPVKAGIAKRWQDWPWTYCRKEVYDALNAKQV